MNNPFKRGQPFYNNKRRMPPRRPHYSSQHYTPPENSGPNIKLVLGIVGVVIIIGLLSLFLFFSEERKSTTQENLPAGISDSTTSSAVVDCGIDIDCLIEEAEDCSLAKATIESTLDFFGVLITTFSYSEIKGVENNKCIFFSITENQKFAYDEEIKTQLLEEGITEEELNQNLEEVSQEAEKARGTGSVCRFDNSDLISYLEMLKEGIPGISISGELTPERFEGETKVGDLIVDCDYIPSN